MIDKTNFARKLTELRNKCGLSQNRLADMLFISGQAVGKWENANSLPDIELLLPLAQILGVSVDCLLGYDVMADNTCPNNSEIINEVITGFDLSDEKVNILTAMSGSISREYLYKAAKYMEPPVIIEIGSGCAAGIRKFINFIDWECIIVLTDLSHRILKYDKRFIDEILSNSKIKIVYLACDVKNLPFKDNVIPCVISYGGYEGVFYNYIMPFKEVYRVLTAGGINIYTITLVSDRQNGDTQKWLKRILKIRTCRSITILFLTLMSGMRKLNPLDIPSIR